MNRRISNLAAAAVLFLAVAFSPSRASTPIPDKSCAISLNGAWRFKLEQAPTPPRYLGLERGPIPIAYPKSVEPFYQMDYREDSAWSDILVPGNWEMAGFSPATYDQPDNASGLYRLMFEVPRSWQGQLVKINFDGVQNGCEVWCNGQPVAVDEASWGRTNYHESGWTAWQADLTPVVKFGQKNLLALRVTKNNQSTDCDTGDFFFLGGVHRPVTLFSVPPTHIADLSIRTKLQPNDNAEVAVIVRLSQAAAGCKVSMHLGGQPAMSGEPDADGNLKLTQTVHHPKLWSAEFPNLYSLAVELKEHGGQTTERLTRRVGIREISVQDGVFRVNNVPVKLVGICRHDVYPTLGTALNPDIWRKDLALMKAANFNAIRTSHYPYGSGFYDLCDEMGFYVLDEEPFCWVNCDDPALMPAFEQRSQETVARDKNHACVVIWGVGNENKPGRNNTRAAQITLQMDPTRPRLVSSQRADEGGADVEFDDKHYVTPAQIHNAENDKRRARIPMIYTENPNVWEVRNGPDYGSLDLWSAVIDRTWKEVWKDEHVAGTFLWEWQDRAVADTCPTKYYHFFPQTGISLLKVKGVVDGFRDPRPEYFHIKMAQSPVAIGNNPEVKPDGVVLEVTNRYSFTDLSLLRARWSLSKGSRNLESGAAHFSLAPRSAGTVTLKLPASAYARADTLRLDLDHPGGWNVATWQFFLKPINHPAPTVQEISDVMFPRFNLVSGKVIPDPRGWKRLDRNTGQLVNLRIRRNIDPEAETDEATLSATPLAEVRSIDADVMLQPTNTPAGHLHAELSNGKLNYQFTWTAAKSDVYELGWVFHVPKAIDHFSWSRKAVWSYYPPAHIGRSTGTATPDSAGVELTRVDRPDAFDFNSTKFNCDWASLTDAHERGLCVIFSPDQRAHVRGGVEADGTCTLVVNRCYSPPRDISSNIVPDLYTVLNKNDRVQGSFQIDGVAGLTQP